LSSLEIGLLADFRLSWHGHAVASFGSPRTQSLLAYLILNRDAAQGRQKLSFLFWPDSDESQARTNLRRELHHLRRALPAADQYLRIDNRSVQWLPEASFGLDVSAFEAAADEAERLEDEDESLLEAAQAAARLYSGPLLPSCYDEWLTEERARLQRRAEALLERLTRVLEGRRMYAAAIPHAQRLLELDPLREASSLRLMRLQALAGERTAALATYRRCAAVLEREFGVGPGAAIEALHASLSTAADPQTARVAEARPELIGRVGEWESLLRAWQGAAAGEAGFALISGDPGIGKTRLAEALLDWAARQGVTHARTRSYAAEGRLAFAPVSDWLRSEPFGPALARLEPVWLTEVFRLLPELAGEHPDLARPAPLTESWQRQHLFEALARVTVAVPQPILVFIDDLQWCDSDTLEWLHYLLRFDPSARLLVVGTVRSEELDDNRQLRAFLLELRKKDRLTEIELGPLDSSDSAKLAAQVAGKELSLPDREALFTDTEGHPLVIVEATRARMSATSSPIGRDGGRHLPPRVQAVIASRLAQLSDDARDVVQLAATLGRAFGFAVLARASDKTEEALISALDELWQRHIIREPTNSRVATEHGAPDQSYDFSHDLLREVAYGEVSPIKRRSLHARVAAALESVHAASLDAVSARLAAHFYQAGQLLRAIEYYQRAAEVALAISASEESIRLWRRALSALAEQPTSEERDRQELALQYSLSAPLTAMRGYPSGELEKVLTRVRALGESLGQPEPVAQSLAGLLAVHFVRGDIRQALKLGDVALSRAASDTSPLAENHLMVGGALVSSGDLERGNDHFEMALASYDPAGERRAIFGSDPDVFARAWQATALWLQGYPERSQQRSQEALERAAALDHPYSMAVANAYAALAYQLRRDVDRSRIYAQEAKDLCAHYGFIYYGDWGAVILGWAESRIDPEGEGVAQIRRGLANLRSLGAESRRPYYLSLLAEAHLAADQGGAAQAILDAALSTAIQNSDLWWSAELHRLQGTSSAPHLSEAHFARALVVARQQGNKALELRAALSMGRLWRSQGRQADAESCVAEVFAWFTEGFESWDLREAKAFLDGV